MARPACRVLSARGRLARLRERPARGGGDRRLPEPGFIGGRAVQDAALRRAPADPLEQWPEPALLLDDGMIVRAANAPARTLLGAAPGLGLLDLLDAADRPAAEAALRLALPFDTRFAASPDRWWWLRPTPAPASPAATAPAPEGEWRGRQTLLLGSDVTTRRACEKSSRRNAVEHVLQALDELRDAFVIYDRDGRLVVCNRRFRDLYGYTEEQAHPGVHFRELGEIDVRRGNVIIGDGEGMDGYLERKAEYRRRLSGGFDVLLRDGRWLQTRDRRMPDGGFVSIQTDITETRRASSELRAAKDAAEQALRDAQAANAQLAQFAYVASHDLREPLRMVISYLDLLQRRHCAGLTTEALEFMEHARDGARRMNQLLLDLLAYSRVGRGDGGPAEVDTEQVVRMVAANLALAEEESGGSIVVDGRLPVVVGRQPELMSLFQNLIGNALKYRHPDRPPRVRISAEKAGPRALFRVADNGIGIDARFHDRIFQIFQRLHARGAYEGTGIGLALCRRIVEHHGGTITVQSDCGRGSTFTFTLPLPDDAE